MILGVLDSAEAYGMYFNRSTIEPPICIYFILLFLIFLSGNVQQIEGKLAGSIQRIGNVAIDFLCVVIVLMHDTFNIHVLSWYLSARISIMSP